MESLIGTKEEILLYVDSIVPQSGKLMETIIDLMDQDSNILSDLDHFNKIRIQSSGEQLVIQSYKYFINLSKATFLLLGLLSATTNNININILEKLLQAFFNNNNQRWFKKLDSNTGEMCIMLEAASNRRNGIDEKHFCKECFNNHIDCGLRREYRCTLTEEELKKASLNKLLEKRGNKYYYTDWI